MVYKWNKLIVPVPINKLIPINSQLTEREINKCFLDRFKDFLDKICLYSNS